MERENPMSTTFVVVVVVVVVVFLLECLLKHSWFGCPRIHHNVSLITQARGAVIMAPMLEAKRRK